MSVKKKGLGKGLSALVQESIDNPFVEIVPDQAFISKNQNGVLMVDIETILPSRYQPRKEFDQSFLEELAESIRKYGVIQPLVVSNLGNNTYELVAGERRLRASKLVDLKTVPIVIKDFEDKDRLAVALIENIQRADLNAIEVAEAYQEMIDRLDVTQEVIATTVGKSRASVANTLRLLKLPESIRLKIANGAISEGHGRCILSLYPDFEMMGNLVKICEDSDLSVRQTEELVREMLKDGITKSSESTQKKNILSSDARMIALEEKILKFLGVKTKISGDAQKGFIKLFYHNPDELQVLVQNIIGNKE